MRCEIENLTKGSRKIARALERLKDSKLEQEREGGRCKESQLHSQLCSQLHDQLHSELPSRQPHLHSSSERVRQSVHFRIFNSGDISQENVS